MALCPNCGADNFNDSKFCAECGFPMPQPEAPAAAAAVAIPEVPAPAPEAPAAAPEAPVSAPEAPAPELTFDAPQPTYTPPQPVYSQPQTTQTNSQPVYAETVPTYASGGLVAWAAVAILLCLIPGVVALINALGINNCATVEEQQKKIANTKTWCIVATALGVLSIISSLATRLLGR